MTGPTPDPLADERAIYLAASQASMNASLDAKIEQDRDGVISPSTLAAMVALQVDVLAAHDRFVQRAERLGLVWREVAQLREGRADLALVLQRTRAALDQRHREH